MFDEIPIKSLRHLSQSTDSLNRSNQVTESMESLTDEGQSAPRPLLTRPGKDRGARSLTALLSMQGRR